MSRKQDNRTSNGQPIVQLTSNQLIFAVCCLIVTGALLILLGMALAHLEPTQMARQDPEEESTVIEAPPVEVGEGQQISPRPLLREDREPASRPRPVEIPAPTPEELDEIDLPPVPLRPSEPISPPPAPDAIEEPAPTIEEPEPAPIPEQEDEVDEFEKESEPEAEPEAEDSADDMIPEIEPDIPAEPARERAGYTVQVAAFSLSNIVKAREFVQEHEAYDPELVEGDDGFVRVFIGSFATREEADQRRRELRSVNDFAECYVRSLN